VTKTLEIKYCEHFGHSDKGPYREKNEDFFGSSDTINGSVFVVCDGIGGNPSGETASRLAVSVILNFFKHEWHKNPQLALRKALEKANTALLQYGQLNPESEGLGTTVVVVLVRENKFWFAHLGDSRIYFTGGNKIFQLTEDHTFVQGLVKKNQITEIEAKTHPRRNEIQQALGIALKPEPQVSEKPFFPVDNSYLLLCSDGLSSFHTETSLSDIIFSEKTVQTKTENLVAGAIDAGSDDNTTALLVRFFNTGNIEEFKPRRREKSSKRRTKKLLVPFLMLFAITLVSIFWIFGKYSNIPESSEFNNFFSIIRKNTYVQTYSSAKQDTSIQLFFSEKTQFELICRTLSDNFPGDSLIFKITKTDQGYQCLLHLKQISVLAPGQSIFTILAFENINYEDLLILNNKSTLTFLSGDQIIIPLTKKERQK
jgi:serine/threonine protein phosphatase PrpC